MLFYVIFGMCRISSATILHRKSSPVVLSKGRKYGNSAIISTRNRSGQRRLLPVFQQVLLILLQQLLQELHAKQAKLQQTKAANTTDPAAACLKAIRFSDKKHGNRLPCFLSF
jgi:ABC-type polar amino acid transport system ATPase subunit